jgi:symplekin
MFRPPARDICLDALEDIYRTCKYHVLPLATTSDSGIDEESRPTAGKILAKWRPLVVEQQQPQPIKHEGQPESEITANGTMSAPPSGNAPTSDSQTMLPNIPQQRQQHEVGATAS